MEERNVKYFVERNHHPDETGVALSCGNVYRKCPVLSFLVQVGSMSQQQATELGVAED